MQLLNPNWLIKFCRCCSFTSQYKLPVSWKWHVYKYYFKNFQNYLFILAFYLKCLDMGVLSKHNFWLTSVLHKYPICCTFSWSHLSEFKTIHFSIPFSYIFFYRYQIILSFIVLDQYLAETKSKTVDRDIISPSFIYKL